MFDASKRDSIFMTEEKLISRVSIDPEICSGRPYIRGTRIYIAIILDALVEGLTPEKIIDHYPVLELDDIHAAVLFASRLAEANGGMVFVNHKSPSPLPQLR